MGKKPGEKGKCLSCKHCYTGKDEINSWCMYNRMRIIYEVKLSSEDRGLKYAQIKEKYKGQIEILLQRKINPYWCPLRQEEFR